jgi:uncharacterized membrane protein YjfL (UPF0719 family)
MSGDEMLVVMASLVVAGVCWSIWNWQLVQIHSLVCGPGLKWSLALLPLVCAALLLFILRRWSAEDVRDDLRYLLMYQILGAAWVLLAATLLPYLGYSLRDDVLERRNGAAAWAITGALVALTLCFAGGNIGNGPGWWVVVFSAGVATTSLLGLWLGFEFALRPSRAITSDRDHAAGLRLAGLLVAAGMILGRGVAGDWISVPATIRDFFAHAWPVLPLVAAAGIIERLLPPAGRGAAGLVLAGMVPAILYVGGAAAWLSQVGLGV